ncbi:MAG: hypothetical protein HY788_08060 [Deltaproteobacteria bacterium]|nr:hypothetical protein [Deltaproteobacteria bacterium]
MIDYAKKSSVALWKTRGNPFARYHTKDWGMAWILEHVPIEEGMTVLDVGHGRNEHVADFFLSKGCTFYAMDKITAPQRPGSSLPEFDDLRNYADELERRGGFYIDRFCGTGRSDEDLIERFDLIFSLGVLEHAIEWGYPMSIFPILFEMVLMLKTGGLLANIYEPCAYRDNPFHIAHDIAFLYGYVELLDPGHKVPVFDRMPGMYEIATNPDTIITDTVETYTTLKGVNGYTALGYMGRKIRNMPPFKLDRHKDINPSSSYEKYRWIEVEGAEGATPPHTYRRVLCFGAASRFKQWFPKLTRMFPEKAIVGVLDNDSDKWGRTIEGIPILSPDRIRDIDPDLVVVTTMFHTSVVAELEYLKSEYGLEFDIRIV